jgi:two-component system sensor histidine kinase/response regulator
VLLVPFGTRIDHARLAAGGFETFVTRPVRPSALLDALLSSAAAAAAAATPSDEAPAAAGAPPAPGRPRVLLVEDNAVNRLVALPMLELEGHDAEWVDHGVAAVERLRAADFDLVLMDCQMPVRDGCQATRLVRDPASSVRDPAIPILALTANAMEGDREKCLAAGMDDHVAKPVRREELAEALERWRRRPSEAPRG